MTVPELVVKAEAFGLPISGCASKTVSDSLRWEVRKGRVVRVDRSGYRAGSMPRSTEWWIRKQVAAYQSAVAQTPAEEEWSPAASPVEHG